MKQLFPSFGVLKHRARVGEELLRYEAMTGLNNEQLTDLVARLHELCGDKFVSTGPPLALGLFRSVALVVCLMRKNVTQDFAGAVFGVSQSTVSRRWDLLRPLIGDALAEVVPDPLEVVGRGTVLVDGTVCPTWDWRHVPDLFSAKTGHPGMNLQIAATLDGQLAAVGPVPVHGARHDAYAFAASGLAEVLTDYPTVADLGYVGVEGIDTVPYKRFPGIDLNADQVEFNTVAEQDPGRRRTCHRAPQDMANAQRRRRSLPSSAGKVPQHDQSGHRTILLCGL